MEATTKGISVIHRLPLLLICKQIHSEITPALLSSITFRFGPSWRPGSQFTNFSHRLTASLSMTVDLKRLVLHFRLARDLFAELEGGGLQKVTEITLLGRGRISSCAKDRHRTWTIAVSDVTHIMGSFLYSFMGIEELKPIPCDIWVQFAPYHDDGQVCQLSIASHMIAPVNRIRSRSFVSEQEAIMSWTSLGPQNLKTRLDGPSKT